MGTVGKSHRTPAKHALLNFLIGREAGVAGLTLPYITKLRWVDLTAGDGVAPDNADWWRNCSPGLFAHHAAAVADLMLRSGRTKPVEVLLFEKAGSTFRLLMESLGKHLPTRGYEFDGCSWNYQDTVTLTAIRDSAENLPLDGVTSGTAIFLNNDPNAITNWAMRHGLPDDLYSRTTHISALSTLGCNTGGLFRLPLLQRLPWFGLIDGVERGLRPTHDLVLAAIRRDGDRWGYLLWVPSVWYDETAKGLSQSFHKAGLEIEHASLRKGANEFHKLQPRLFLRADEQLLFSSGSLDALEKCARLEGPAA